MTAHRIPEGPHAVHDSRHLIDENWLTRVMVVDADPDMRAGLSALLRDDLALDPLASAATGRDALVQARRLQPDVVIVSHHLPDQDGLLLTYRLRAVADPPAVLLRAADEDPVLAVAAIIAGADGLLSERSDGKELRYAIRWLANGGRWMPEVPPTVLGRLTAGLGAQDKLIFRALLHGVRPSYIRSVLGITDRWLAARRWAILQRLRREI